MDKSRGLGAVLRRYDGSVADKPKKHDPDERVAIPLNPEQALRALMAVDPGSEPGSEPERCRKTWMGKRCLLKAGHFGPCQFQA